LVPGIISVIPSSLLCFLCLQSVGSIGCTNTSIDTSAPVHVSKLLLNELKFANCLPYKAKGKYKKYTTVRRRIRTPYNERNL